MWERTMFPFQFSRRCYSFPCGTRIWGAGGIAKAWGLSDGPGIMLRKRERRGDVRNQTGDGKTFYNGSECQAAEVPEKANLGRKKISSYVSACSGIPDRCMYTSVDESKGKTVRWLLDGRQRKNALTMIHDDPENIYNWAKSLSDLKFPISPAKTAGGKYWEKINEYIGSWIRM